MRLIPSLIPKKPGLANAYELLCCVKMGNCWAIAPRAINNMTIRRRICFILFFKFDMRG
jgi:hypothetical protein